MSKGACRDCPRCTESPINAFGMIPFRLVHWLLTIWNIRMFQKWCPQCGHRLSIHRRVGGRFAD